MGRDDIIIEFPDRINRYRLIATIEADIFFLGVGTMIGVLSLSWFILGASGVGFLMTGTITATVLFLYIQYKEKNKKGFLMHWLYSRGLWRPKYKGYEGLSRNFLPEIELNDIITLIIQII